MHRTFDDVFSSPPSASPKRMTECCTNLSHRARNRREAHNWRRFYARENRKTGLRVWLSFFLYLFTRFFTYSVRLPHIQLAAVRREMRAVRPLRDLRETQRVEKPFWGSNLLHIRSYILSSRVSKNRKD